MEDEIIEEFLERLAKLRVSLTTGTSTSMDGTTKNVWEWWDSDGGNSRGRTFYGLLEHLHEKELRISKNGE